MTAESVGVNAGDVSRETSHSLLQFESLLKRWNPKINLVSPSTLLDIQSRHIEDSLQLLDLAPDQIRTWVDFGSGGGLPGLPIAIVAAASRPGMTMTLVESDKRKSAFLREASRQLGLNVRVVDKRLEDVEPLHADVISARAVSDLPRLLDLAQPHLAPNGICIFPKGSGAAEEIEAARQAWSFQCRMIPSKTQPDSAILVISEIHRA
jgi:16S rRNA (guanine527-N7)-methyltransferase